MAELVREYAPGLIYETGMSALPVDFRQLPGHQLLGRRGSRGRGAGRVRAERGFGVRARRRLPRGRAASGWRGLLGRSRRQPLPPVLLLLPGERHAAQHPRRSRASRRRLGVIRRADRARGRCGSPRVIPPRLQLRARDGQLGLRRRDRAAARLHRGRRRPSRGRLGPGYGLAVRLRRQPRRQREGRSAADRQLDQPPRRQPDPARADRRCRRAGRVSSSRSTRPGARTSGGTPRRRGRAR